MDVKKLSLKSLHGDKETMPRAKMDEDYVEDLLEDLKSGVKFPPVNVINDGAIYILVDGYHRCEAANRAGFKKIEAVVGYGNKRDAVLFASGVNASHGKRRTNADKRKAVRNLLKDKEWCEMSDNQIAKHCKVSQPFVSNQRTEIKSTYNDYKSPSRRKTKTGGIMDTKNIGNGGSNSREQKKTVSAKIIPTKEDLPPKPSAKKKPAASDDVGGGDDTEIPTPPIDYTTVLAEAHKLIKDFEAALCDFKKALPPKSKSNSLSEIDFSGHWKKMKQSWSSFAVFYAKDMTNGA